MADNESRRGLTLMKAFELSVAIAAFFAVIYLNTMASRVERAEADIKGKVDVAEFMHRMDRVDEKLDKIDDTLRKHEINSLRRSKGFLP